MKLPRLIKATLIKRYKRFLADVKLDDKTITVHVPNSGRMTTVNTTGSTIYLSKSENPKRKYAYTWELIDNQKCLISVNTMMANKIVLEALQNKKISSLKKYNKFKPEVKIGDSRIDILAENENKKCFIEIKSVSLCLDGKYLFPDAPTIRGQKHLRELIKIRESGDEAVIFFLLMRSDGSSFSPHKEIDSKYANLLNTATEKGVEILVYNTVISLNEIKIGKQLNF